VIECEPTVSVEISRDAFPLARGTALPKAVIPSKKVTLPDGIPAAEVTVAVNVRVWPTVAEFSDDVSEVDEG
jgi:hypothetical protein